MRPPLSFAPALPAATGIIAGILLYSMGAIYFSLCLTLAVFMILTLANRQYLSYFALFTACGIIVSAAHEPTSVPEETYTGTHTVQCRILRTVQRPQSTAYVVEVQRLDSFTVSPFKARVAIGSVENVIPEGCTAKFKAAFRNSDSPSDIPHEADYNKYLKADGIVCTGVIISGIDILSSPDAYHRIATQSRETIYNAIVDSPISASAASFLVAAILGDRTLLTEEDFRHYRSVGVAHILALSGLHVGIIATLISMMLFPLNLCSRRKIPQGITVILLIWIYTIIAGMQPSILRASVMITVVILSGYMQRGYYVFNSLFLSIVVILAINPSWLYTPGFQLSVAAVASLLMFGNLVPARLKRHPILYFMLNLAIMPVAAMMGTGIVSAYYFGTFPLMFIFGNIVVGVLFPWLLGGGIVLALSTYIGIHFGILGVAVDIIYKLMATSLTMLRDTGGEITNLYFSAWVILPYAIALIFLSFAIRERKRYQWLMCMSMLPVCVMVNSCNQETLPKAELYIPRHAPATRIIMRSGNEARLYTDAKITDDDISECDSRYHRFLLSRGCPGHFEIAYDGWSYDYFAIDADYIQAGNRLIRIIRRDINIKAHNRRADYGLITNNYTGSISAIREAVICDTLLLGPDLHPARKARMIRECADSIPYRDIKAEGFSIIF